MKKIIILSAFLFSCVLTNAQLHIKTGVCANFANGKMADYWVGGPGVDVNAKYLIINRIGIGVSTGFQHFFAKDWGSSYEDMSFNVVPIRLSLSGYIFKGPFRVYFGMELGHNITKISYRWTGDIYDPYYHINGDERYENKDGRFGVAPLFGIHLDFGRFVALDIGHKFNFINRIDSNSPKQNASYFGTNIGLVIKIGEKKAEAAVE